MKVCFPTETLQGLKSRVYSHFGSAPAFVIVDMPDMTFEEVGNSDLHHDHGMCQPLKALGNRTIDAVVVGGIGAGALMKLQAEGIAVFRAAEGTVQENVDLIASGKLPRFEAKYTCQGHTGGGCAH